MSRHGRTSSRTGNAGSSRRRSAGGTLIGIFIGLVLGVVAAFAIAWYINRTPFPFQAKWGKPATEKPGEAKQAPPPTAEPSRPAPASSSPAPLPGKPGDKPLEKPRFDFYKVLPEGEQAAPVPAPKPQASGAEPLYLQVGSFQNPIDADNLKAKLALMGLEAAVMQADVPDKGTMHRVRIGPFDKPEEMNRARTELALNGIQASVVKGRQ